MIDAYMWTIYKSKVLNQKYIKSYYEIKKKVFNKISKWKEGGFSTKELN